MIEFNPTGMNLGYLPGMLSVNDQRSAREQLHAGYSYGGGFTPMRGFTMRPGSMALEYPGDPPMKPVATATLRDETIVVYPYSFVAVVQADGTFEVSRMD